MIISIKQIVEAIKAPVINMTKAPENPFSGRGPRPSAVCSLLILVLGKHSSTLGDPSLNHF